MKAIRQGWKRAGTFYVHVGTQESLGSDLPPGVVALVEPIDAEVAPRPNPRSIYLLQFRNGYRCSPCVVTQTKLQLLTSDRATKGQKYSPIPRPFELQDVYGRLQWSFRCMSIRFKLIPLGITELRI